MCCNCKHMFLSVLSLAPLSPSTLRLHKCCLNCSRQVHDSSHHSERAFISSQLWKLVFSVKSKLINQRFSSTFHCSHFSKSAAGLKADGREHIISNLTIIDRVELCHSVSALIPLLS